MELLPTTQKIFTYAFHYSFSLFYKKYINNLKKILINKFGQLFLDLQLFECEKRHVKLTLPQKSLIFKFFYYTATENLKIY